MQPSQRAPSRDFDLKVLAALFALGCIVFHLFLASADRGLSRDQHLGTAVVYAKTQIDLLRPIVLGANANGAPYPLEFPIWQAITGGLMKLFGLWYGWGNVVSLLFHLSSLWPLFQLAKGLFSERAAWWALVFYLAQPLTFLWGGLASADAMSATFAMWFLYFFWRAVVSGSWAWWPAGAVAGCLSATTKAPFFFVAGLTAFFWVLHGHRRSSRAWGQLISLGAISVVVFAAWNYHCHRCYELGEMLYTDPRLGRGKPIMQWWFGDLAVRLQAKSWIRGGWRAATILLGSIGLIFLPAAALFFRETSALRWWIAAGFCTLLVFTSLIFIHWHYYYIFSFPAALLCAKAAAEFEPGFWRSLPPMTVVRMGLPGVALAASLAQGLNAAHLNLYLDPHPARSAQLIRAHTDPQDKIAVWGGGWTIPLLRAERSGLSLFDFDPINDTNKLARLKELGYSKLVLMNTSPLLVAINTVSGSAAFQRKDLRKEVPPVAQQWPIIFETEAVLILRIPE